MKTLILKEHQLKLASQALQQGEVIAFPTETVFGLGVIFDNYDAYLKLVEVKRRPPTQPFTLMCGSVDDIEKYAVIDDKTRLIINNYMPGQLTIII